MNKVVHQLRIAREAKGIALKEVEEITKIRTKYLQALEDGDYGVLPGGVYTVGFLRSYARFLDLDAENLVNTFRMEATVAKLETTFDDALQETNKPYRERSLLIRISQFYREAGDILRFLKTSRIEQSKR